MEYESSALRKMQAKVAKDMSSVQGPLFTFLSLISAWYVTFSGCMFDILAIFVKKIMIFGLLDLNKDFSLLC